MRRTAHFALLVFAAALPAFAQPQWGTWTPDAGAFGDWRWGRPRADVATILALTGAPGECLAAQDIGAIYCWAGGVINAWVVQGGGDTFETIATSSGTSPVADSATDTLNVTAGAGITVTGNAATDTIIIASTVTDTDDQNAVEVTYDPTASGLAATDVQAAVDELAADPGVSDHGALTGLGDDDHLQYTLLAGRAGGQTAYGGTGDEDGFQLFANVVEGSGGATLTLGGGSFAELSVGASGTINLFGGAGSSINLGSGLGTVYIGGGPSQSIVGSGVWDLSGAASLTGTLTGNATTATTATTANAGDSATAYFPAGTIEADRLPALSAMNGAVTDAQVPNTITIDLATQCTTALAGDSASAFFSSGTIEPARLGTGSGGATKFLREDSTWQTVSGGGSSSGTGLQKGDGAGGFTDTGIASANGGAAITSTSASTVPLLVTGASAQSANYFNVSASAGAAGGIFKIDSAGRVWVLGGSVSPTAEIQAGDGSTGSAAALEFRAGGTNSGGTINFWGGNGRVSIRAGASAYDVWEQLRGTSAQTWRLYRTASSQSGANWTNYERLAIQSGAGYFELTPESAGSGAADLEIRMKSKGQGRVTLSGVAQLPPRASPPSTPAEGDLYVDTSHALCYYDGAAWQVLNTLTVGVGACS